MGNVRSSRVYAGLPFVAGMRVPMVRLSGRGAHDAGASLGR
jgi:hypothetical protein